ncbi:hypothetical protein GCM10007941_00920 [Amphritea balenae]|nr:hypothetical protein GCM10007941_00920 [Amphritea balenae]
MLKVASIEYAVRYAQTECVVSDLTGTKATKIKLQVGFVRMTDVVSGSDNLELERIRPFSERPYRSGYQIQSGY